MASELSLYISAGFFSVILFYLIGAGYSLIVSLINGDERG